MQVHVLFELWAGPGGQVLEVTVSLKPETGTRITGKPPFGARNEFVCVFISSVRMEFGSVTLKINTTHSRQVKIKI